MTNSPYKGIWMSPNIIIKRFNELAKKCGLGFAITHTRCKHEREAWVGAVFALGQRHMTGWEYWVEVETKQATPDVYVSYIKVIKGNNHRFIYNLEITDWVENSEDIIEIINKKLTKQYPSYFFLIVYARWPGKMIDFNNLHNEIKKQKIPFNEIWILMAYTNNNDYQLTKIYPHKGLIQFNLNTVLEGNKSQKSFARFWKRGKGTNPIILGRAPSIPLPECDIRYS